MLIDLQHHLTYCTNIHQGETWEEVFKNLITYLPCLKNQLTPNSPLGIGLRLSDVASRELLDDNRLTAFKKWLDSNGLYIFTMNGFPYGGFHNQVVKDDVHKPDWTTVDRLAYTKRLAHILASLLPQGVIGGISTSPLSYKPWHGQDQDKINEVYSSSTAHMVELVEELVNIQEATGKTIHIDIEPEPDGLIENSTELIEFYSNWLLPMGCRQLAESKGFTKVEAQRAILTHIQVCYDVCHFALAYEKPKVALAKLAMAGIKIGKVQLSAALKASIPEDKAQRQALAVKLQPFAESTYLHQVIEQDKFGKLKQYTDLPAALEALPETNAQEWRTHFHVPLFTSEYNGLQSTQDDIKEVLWLMTQQHVSCHLEIETYTWEVLPEGLKKDLSDSIRREMDWVLQTIKKKQHEENGSPERSRTYAVAAV
ncbi:metabolite traffic protein EboE [Pontibacter sp. SGAir0037]|uniref:metabolite traffic protein EboE n=1 Tax=Pontibacter sp. SGAir0037 TaxID=2571030 RepID=UPI0010CD371F|nr:metabolite traffic protein EboE [Pontibacter sp. SGAir0037]QCR21520.1 xylose isomerase [Pontibacter sp. SGAir0037]